MLNGKDIADLFVELEKAEVSALQLMLSENDIDIMYNGLMEYKPNSLYKVLAVGNGTFSERQALNLMEKHSALVVNADGDDVYVYDPKMPYYTELEKAQKFNNDVVELLNDDDVDFDARYPKFSNVMPKYFKELPIEKRPSFDDLFKTRGPEGEYDSLLQRYYRMLWGKSHRLDNDGVIAEGLRELAKLYNAEDRLSEMLEHCYHSEKFTIILSRHDEYKSKSLTPMGAANAYMMAKHRANHLKIENPQYIVYSPIQRAEETAKMHEISLRRNNFSKPLMEYDEGFHENASIDHTIRSFDKAIKYAKSQGFSCIEIITHEPNIMAIVEDNYSINFRPGYGGSFIIKYDEENRVTGFKEIESSKKFRNEVIGKAQADMLDYLNNHHNLNKLNESKEVREAISTQARKNKTRNPLGDDYEVNSQYYSGIDDYNGEKSQEVIKLFKEHQETIEAKWVNSVLKGGETNDMISPTEYLEVMDVNNFWINNKMSIMFGGENLLHSNLQEYLFGRNGINGGNQSTVFGQYIAPEVDEPHNVFNAYAQRLKDEKGIKNPIGDKINAKRTKELQDFPSHKYNTNSGKHYRIENDKEAETTKTRSTYTVSPCNKRAKYLKDNSR